MTKKQKELLHAVMRPGKFEGEKPWVPYFWWYALDGESDRQTEIDGVLVDWFRINESDRATLGELSPDAYGVAVWEDGNGFVYGGVCRTGEEFEAEIFG